MEDIETLKSEVDNTKREFMKKFGVYAATAPVGMYMLMTPSASAHAMSDQNNGWGNGDQRAPGNSWRHNKAENNHKGKRHRIHGDARPN